MSKIANWKCLCLDALWKQVCYSSWQRQAMLKYPLMQAKGQGSFCTAIIQLQTSSSLFPQSSKTAPATASAPMRRTQTSRCPTHTRPCRTVPVQTAAPHPQQSTEIPCLPQSPTRRIWRRSLYSNSARSS